MTVRIIIGDALHEIRKLPDQSVHTCCTSPPYWGLRCYGGHRNASGFRLSYADAAKLEV